METNVHGDDVRLHDVDGQDDGRIRIHTKQELFESMKMHGETCTTIA